MENRLNILNMENNQMGTCPVCHSRESSKVLNTQNRHGRHTIDSKDEFELYNCHLCDAKWIANLKTDRNYYEKYYPKQYYKGTDSTIINTIIDTLSTRSARKKGKMIRKHFKNNIPITILDIGCGTGDFLSKLESSQFNKVGLEINPEGAEICRSKGIKVLNEDLQNLKNIETKYDAITLWHVLEHLPEPNGAIKKIHGLLSNNGILMMEVPNTKSMGYKFGKENWFHMDSPRHLVHYNTKAMQKLCSQNGFEVVKVKSVPSDYPLDLFWSVKNSVIRFLIYPFYPLAKYLSKETLLFICKKTNNPSPSPHQ